MVYLIDGRFNFKIAETPPPPTTHPTNLFNIKSGLTCSDISKVCSFKHAEIQIMFWEEYNILHGIVGNTFSYVL